MLARICVLVMLAASPVLAYPKPEALLDDLSTTHYFEEVAISPDGHRVAWVEKIIDKGRDTGRVAVFASTVDGASAARKLGEGRQLAWSHDGKRLAWVDKQLTVATIGGGVTTLTKLDGTIGAPAWSPDDARIAILFAEHNAGGGPLNAEPAATGEIGGAIHNQRITLVDVKTRAVASISPPELHVYEAAWSPDGKTFALTAAPGPGDNNWWTAQLYTLAVAGGAPTPIYKPELQIAQPLWSPDGQTIAFIGGLMSDEGFTGGDIYTIAATGGKAVNHTPGRASSPNTLAWISPTQMLVSEYVGGSSAFSTLDLATGKLAQLWQGGESIHAGTWGNLSIARDGTTVAVVRSDVEHPPEVWAGAIGSWKQLTHLNASHHPAWGDVKSLTWKSDGRDVQGWLLYPADFDASKRYPMIVVPHGGPAGIAMPAWPEPSLQEATLAALGYFVFFPNPRGSFGQGEAFVRANVKDFGGGDLRDVMTGVDAALKLAPIDPARLGITGWSYGGYMTMWAITQTNRFKAAIAGAGISDWQSYYGENSIDQWMIPYFGASVYDDPAVYAKSSPITFVKKVRTPTLIVVGERDGECPAPQSYELWHALAALGVTTSLVVYPNEGHAFVDPKHKRDLLERGAAWFDKYLR
ncbi:MAG TPA: S9 family peptidase [Kofleriaceae bacterium]|jgi:dipeptidyl aminopeptidase/acylaminoacyl peptidase